MVLESLTHYPIRQKALDLTKHLPPRDYRAEIRAVRNYVLRSIRYVQDMATMETLSYPQHTLEIKQGDCDDKCMLAAALLLSINHPVRFLAVGFNPNNKLLSHVLIETRVGVNWVPVELCVDIPMGEYPRNITSTMIQYIK